MYYLEDLKLDVLNKKFLIFCEQLKNSYNSKYFPLTYNGPYKDHETSIRKCSHDLISFSYCYQITKSNIWKNLCIQIWQEYFLSLDYTKPIIFRNTEDKNKVNGLIGASWLIEGLSFFSKTFNIQEPKLKLYEYLNNNFKYKNQGVWQYKDLDDQFYIDTTFNHNLWFISSLADLDSSKFKKIINDFIKYNVENMTLYPSGVIFHFSKLSFSNTKYSEMIYNEYKFFGRFLKFYFKIYKKSCAYHSFNLLGLYKLLKNDFIISKKILNKLHIPFQKKLFNKNLNRSEYSWGYNHPGIEYSPFAHLTKNNLDTANNLLLEDFLKTNFFSGKNTFTKDINLDNSRKYEFVYTLEALKIIQN